MPEQALKGRAALVTGGSRGLGKAMAKALAEAGARVGLVARDINKLHETAGELSAAGADVRVFTTNVADEEQVNELERQARDAFGHVDILINNAGINIRRQVVEFSLDEWNRVMTSNVTSAFLMCRAFIPHMKGRGYGRILNMTSIMSHVSLPGRAAYSASKAALLGMTKSLALELAPDQITVVAISPGPFATEMNTTLMQDPEINQQFVSKIALGRWGRVEEIGKLAVFLCSEDAGFITGTDILIDGGWCAQ